MPGLKSYREVRRDPWLLGSDKYFIILMASLA